MDLDLKKCAQNADLNILISHTSVYKKAGWGRIFPLAAGLIKLGNQVTILTTNPGFSILTKRLVISGVTVIIYPEIIPSRVSRMGFGFLSLIFKILHVIFNKYDVVHSDNGHRPLSGIPCRLHQRIHHSIYAAEWYDWYGKGGQFDSKKKLFKILLGRYECKYEVKDKKIADGVVVLSEVLRSRAEQFKSTESIIKIHGGASVSTIPFLNDNSTLKLKYNISSEVLTFGYINSESYKLAEFIPLLNAITRLSSELNIKILLFGDSDLLIGKVPNELLNHFIFFGWIDFSKDYEKLQLVDLFFLFKEDILGNRAGWPNCIGDYLACGRPVLLNPVGELIDFVEQYPFGFIKCKNEEMDLIRTIKNITGNINDIRDRGKQIRKFAEESVSWEKKSEELFAFYNYLLSRKTSVNKTQRSKVSGMEVN